MDQRWTKDGPTMNQRWTKDAADMRQTWADMKQRWGRHGPKMDKRWISVTKWPKMDKRWRGCTPEMERPAAKITQAIAKYGRSQVQRVDLSAVGTDFGGPRGDIDAVGVDLGAPRTSTCVDVRRCTTMYYDVPRCRRTSMYYDIL